MALTNESDNYFNNSMQQVLQMFGMYKQFKHQEKQEAGTQLETLMKLGGSPKPGAIEGIARKLEMDPSILTSVMKDGHFPSTAEREQQMKISGIGQEAEATAKAGAANEPITTATKLNAMRTIAPEETKILTDREKAVTTSKFETEEALSTRKRKLVADDLREQAKTNEEMAALYFKPQEERKLDELRKTKKISFDFEAKLKSIPPGETSTHKELVNAEIREKNATADWIERGGKDKHTSDKYTDVLKFASAAGLVKTDPKTKMQVIQDVPKGGPQHEAIKVFYNDAGLDYTEIDVPTWKVPFTSRSLGDTNVKIVPKAKQSTSPGAMRTKGGKEATHPLSGQKAGKYKVDGKVVSWDGTKEI